MDYLNYINGLSQLYKWTISNILMFYLNSSNVLSCIKKIVHSEFLLKYIYIAFIIYSSIHSNIKLTHKAQIVLLFFPVSYNMTVESAQAEITDLYLLQLSESARKRNTSH